MTSTPDWLNAIVRDFAAGLGLRNFTLNSSGTAALQFENGAIFRLEYAVGCLALSMSVASPDSEDAAKLLLSASDPMRQGTFAIRTGITGSPPRAVFAIRLDPSSITLGNLDAAMMELWRTAQNHVRRIGE